MEDFREYIKRYNDHFLKDYFGCFVKNKFKRTKWQHRRSGSRGRELQLYYNVACPTMLVEEMGRRGCLYLNTRLGVGAEGNGGMKSPSVLGLTCGRMAVPLLKGGRCKEEYELCFVCF